MKIRLKTSIWNKKGKEIRKSFMKTIHGYSFMTILTILFIFLNMKLFAIINSIILLILTIMINKTYIKWSNENENTEKQNRNK